MIDYIYVVNKNKKLLGVFSIKDLFQLQPEKKANETYKNQTLVAITPKTSLKTAAHISLRNSLKAIPIVDENNILLGVVPPSNLLSIIHREARKEMLQLAGIHRSHVDFDDILKIPVFQAFKHRIPWLIIGLIGGIFTAIIIKSFQSTLETNLILAAFIPLVVYMGSAAGTQMTAFVIRDFALTPKLNYLKYFLKHFLVVSIIAIFIGAIFAVASFIIYNNKNISIAVSVALFLAIISSVFSGLLIPYIFTKLKQDPANASGPISTIIQDILSVVIYFVIVSWLLL